MKTVTSTANPAVKRIRSLNLRKYREEEGVFVAEGLRHALGAMEAGWAFDTVVIEEGAEKKDLVEKLLAHAAKQKAEILSASPRVMESLTKRDNAQNVVAVLKQRWASLDDVKGGLWVALEEIRDPGNLGTILRACDAAGAEGVALIGNTCDPWSLESVRASMGSFADIRVARCGRAAFIEKFKGKFRLMGTHLKTDTDYRRAEYETPLFLVMGNEQAGLSDEMAAACDTLVKIPMRGKADSLNVAIAAALMLYEATRAC